MSIKNNLRIMRGDVKEELTIRKKEKEACDTIPWIVLLVVSIWSIFGIWNYTILNNWITIIIGIIIVALNEFIVKRALIERIKVLQGYLAWLNEAIYYWKLMEDEKIED